MSAGEPTPAWALPVSAFVAGAVGTGNPWVGVGCAMAAYFVWCWLKPWARCRRCGWRGGPKRMDSTGKYWSDCGGCDGSGKRLRIGVRIMGRGRGL